jgi:formylmethanofuran dehydrogenase subunit C
MRGGTIMIDGDAGNEIGHSIRRGLIGVGGRAGDLPGFNMLAGTILIFGECGIRPGGGMKRGTIGLFHEQPPQLLPTFRQGGLVDSVIFSLMNRRLQALGFSANEDRFQMKASRIFHGDFLCGGRGEIFLPM